MATFVEIQSFKQQQQLQEAQQQMQQQQQLNPTATQMLQQPPATANQHAAISIPSSQPPLVTSSVAVAEQTANRELLTNSKSDVVPS